VSTCQPSGGAPAFVRVAFVGGRPSADDRVTIRCFADRVALRSRRRRFRCWDEHGVSHARPRRGAREHRHRDPCVAGRHERDRATRHDDRARQGARAVTFTGRGLLRIARIRGRAVLRMAVTMLLAAAMRDATTAGFCGNSHAQRQGERCGDHEMSNVSAHTRTLVGTPRRSMLTQRTDLGDSAQISRGQALEPVRLT
jgi:hypothetical protein